MAIKGIGGFHLCCDATSEEAGTAAAAAETASGEAFCSDGTGIWEAVKKICKVSEEQEKILTGHLKPILLLDKLPEKRGFVRALHLGIRKVGVMLPYAPVQLLFSLR